MGSFHSSLFGTRFFGDGHLPFSHFYHTKRREKSRTRFKAGKNINQRIPAKNALFYRRILPCQKI